MRAWCYVVGPMTKLRSTASRRAQRYAPWEPAAIYLDAARRRAAARMLHRAGVFPGLGTRCLEVGFGTVGWLAQLLDWGVGERDLHGVERSEACVRHLAQRLPLADLRVGDAEALPWPDDHFDLVVASMVFSAISGRAHRLLVAAEIARVLAPGGVLLWYDIAVGNPCNSGFARVGRSELARLFEGWPGEVRSIGLAPPVARAVVPRSWTLATIVDAIAPVHPFLVAVLARPPRPAQASEPTIACSSSTVSQRELRSLL